MTEDFKRKLTAILSADVVGYSRLMGEDEEATVRTLNKYKQIIFDLIERHNGRLVDSTGDNVLAEFVSVVDAVRCGVQIQEDLKENNEGLPTNRKMEFRIGINTGDVIQDGDRIYGDGVNVAARIESLADPGGICLSRTAYDQVKKKLNYEYEYLGEYEVKNIDDPVRVCRVQMESKVKTEIVKKKKASALSEEPSIAVLPFVNISGDKEQEYFSDGLAEEIINALTKIQGLKVIARTSAFAFKGKDQDITKIAEALRVNTILEGSVRKSGKRIRVTAQLITASDGSHLWSERYDQELTDVFAIQDEISQAIADKLRVRLSGHQPLVKRYTENMEAYNLYLKGRYHLEKFTPEALDKSKNYFEQAIAIDPKYALAWSELADYYVVIGAVYGYTRPRTAYAKCSHAIEKVLELDGTLPEPYAIRAALQAFDYDWEEAERNFHHALELKSKSGGSIWVWLYYSIWYLVPKRRYDEAFATLRKALESDPLSLWTQFLITFCYYSTRQWDRAIEQCQNMIELDPYFYYAHQYLGFTYLQIGEINKGVQSCEIAARIMNQGPWPLAFRAIAYAKADRIDEVNLLLKELHELDRKSYVTPTIFIWIYCSLGEINKALDWAERCIEERDGLFIISREFPLLDPIHSHPHYKALLLKVNLEA